MGRFGSVLVMAVLSSILLAALVACGPEVITEGGAVEEGATPAAVPAPTPLPSDTPTPPLADTPTPVPPFPSIPTPTPTSAPMPTATPDSPPGFAPLPEAELSIEFDSDSIAVVSTQLLRIDFTVTNKTPGHTFGVSLAFEVFGALEVDGPAAVFHAHVVDGDCEESTCDLGSFDGFESVNGYVIVHAKPGTYTEFTVDADLSWLVRNLDTWHSFDQEIVNVLDIDDPRAPMWATGVGIQSMNCGESVQVASERVYMAFGRALYSFAKSDGEELWVEYGDAWHFTPVVAGDNVYFRASVHDPSATYIRAVDALEGTLQWQHLVDGNARGPAAVYGGSVFYTVNRIGVVGGQSSSYLMSLDASTGALNWQYEVDQLISTAAVEYGGNVYFAAYKGGTYLYAIDPTSGELSRRYETQGSLYDAPLIADDTAYIVTAFGLVYSMDLSTGMKNWEYTAEDTAIGTPLLADGMLYVRIWDGEAGIYSSVHALDAATGSLRWQYETGREVFPPVASSGSVYVPGWDNVVALDPETGRPQWVVLVDSFCGRATATEGILYGTGRLNDSYTIFAVRTD